MRVFCTLLIPTNRRLLLPKVWNIPEPRNIPPILVRSFGTEDRPTDHPVKARDEVYEYIIFKASDIKDLVVCEGPKETDTGDVFDDPAIVSVSKPPTRSDPQAKSSAPKRSFFICTLVNMNVFSLLSRLSAKTTCSKAVSPSSTTTICLHPTPTLSSKATRMATEQSIPT